MPVYEFSSAASGQKPFTAEMHVSEHDAGVAECPECHRKEDVEKRLSTFTAMTSRKLRRAVSPAEGSCRRNQPRRGGMVHPRERAASPPSSCSSASAWAAAVSGKAWPRCPSQGAQRLRARLP